MRRQQQFDIKTKFTTQLKVWRCLQKFHRNFTEDLDLQKLLKMAKKFENPKNNKRKNAKAKEELIEEHRKLQVLKRSMSIEQRNLRRETRDLKRKIEEKVRLRDYLLHLRAQRNEAMVSNFANPA